MICKDRTLELDEALPGMVLAAAILDAHGDTLLPIGAALTESTLTSLRRRGIERVVVLNEDISPEELAAERKRLQQRLDSLFRRCGTDGEIGRLFQSVSAYRLGDTP